MLAFLFLSTALSEETISFEQLRPQKIDGQTVQTYQGQPYTGQVFEYYRDGGKREEHNYVDGLEQGIQRAWSPEKIIQTERFVNPDGTQLVKRWSWDGKVSKLIYECNIWGGEPQGACYLDCRDNGNYGADACEVFGHGPQGEVWADYKTGSKIGTWKFTQGAETFYLQHHYLGLQGKIYRETRMKADGEVISTTITPRDMAFEEHEAIDRKFILLRSHDHRFYQRDNSSSVNRIIQERYPEAEYFDVTMKPLTGKIMDFHEDLSPKLLVEVVEGQIQVLKYYDEEGKEISGYRSERIEKKKD